MLRPHIKLVISEMKLRVLVKDVLLILVSITDGTVVPTKSDSDVVFCLQLLS